MLCVDKLIFRLDAAALAGAQQILEGTEHHNRPVLIRPGILLVHIDAVVVGIPVGNKLPPLKIRMAHQIAAPRGLHDRLKGQNQHPLQPHGLGQLIGRKGLAKPHFGVPQKFRGTVRLLPDGPAVVLHGHLHRAGLLRPHPKGLGALLHVVGSVPHSNDGGAHRVLRTPEPLIAVPAVIELPIPSPAQHRMDIPVSKAAPVRAHGRLCQQKPVLQPAGVQLLRNPLVCITALRVAHLDIPLVRRHAGQRIGVDGGDNVGARVKILQIRHQSPPPESIGLTMDSIKSISPSSRPYLA